MIAEYLDPLINQLSSTVSLRFKSQVLYVIQLKVAPKWQGDYYALPQSQLPLTINDIEAKLGDF